jgi:hypothetical protein
MAFFLAAVVAAAAQSTSGPITPLPPSFRRGALSSCAPATVDAAEACLAQALSPNDLKKVQDGSGAYGDGLRCEMEIEWRLTDVNSPMAKTMREKLGIDDAGMAASMIFQDFEMRAAGSGLSWDQVRSDVSKVPAHSPTTTCPVTIPATISERAGAH